MTSPNSDHTQHRPFWKMNNTLLPGSSVIPETNEYPLTTSFINKIQSPTPDFVEQIEGTHSSFPCFQLRSEEKQYPSSLRFLNCLMMQSCNWRNPGPAPEKCPHGAALCLFSFTALTSKGANQSLCWLKDKPCSLSLFIYLF